MKTPTDLSPEAVQSLTDYLASPDRPAGTLSYTALRGFLFAIVNAPDLIPPSEWIGRVFGEDGMEFQSKEDADQAIGGILAVWNDVGQLSKEEQLTPDLLFGAPAAEDVRREWSSGFRIGWSHAGEGWIDPLEGLSEKHREYFVLCQLCLGYFADPAGYHEEWEIPEDQRETWAARMEELFPNAAEFYAKVAAALPRRRPSFRGGEEPIRAEKGPGRNDPCPCGSGKKYKKCCLQ